MRAMRRVLMLLLCCTLAMQGMVQAWAAGATRCPHEQGATPAQMAAAAQADEEADCCNDLAGQLRTGKLCKALFDCPLGTAALVPPPQAVPAPAPSAHTPPVWAERAPPSAPTAAIWRPPAAR
jgi:hypothetical protein